MLGKNKYSIFYTEFVVEEDIPGLPASASKLIQEAIEERLVIDPISFGKPLRYSLKGHRRMRVADYRIVYRIENKNSKVIIVGIKHRKYIHEN